MPDGQDIFRRGRAIAIAGLLVQMVLVGATVTLALWTGNRAVGEPFWHMLGGLPIWLFLVVYYGQREVERREALASEQLTAADAATSLIFGELSDELQRARRRLDLLVGRGLPVVSLLVGGYLVGCGSLRLWRHWALAAGAADASTPFSHPVGMLFAAAGITFFAFVSGRWMSGCAREPAWRLLRGGASYVMSCFLVSSLVLVAALATAIMPDGRFLGVLTVAVPVIMMVVGSEILTMTLLEIYRPRVPGELPRPAFDSRLLGLLTSPESLGDMVGELVRYQFGVDVSGSWFFRLLGKSVVPLALLATGVLTALSCLVVVGPDEEGVVLRWGAVRGPARPAGIHAKLPWPIETAATYPTRRVRQLAVSSDLVRRDQDDEAILWATGDDRLAHIGKEYYPTLLASRGGGIAVVQAEVVVHYRTGDLLAALANAPADAEPLIHALTQQETSRYAACHDLDFLLAAGRATAGSELATRIQERIDQLALGVEIVDVSVTSLQPPGGAVARAFHRQIAAGEQRETIVEKARREAVATLASVAGSVELARRIDDAILSLDEERGRLAAPSDAAPARDNERAIEGAIDVLLAEARGQAAELIHVARGQRWSRSMGEQAARARFAGELLAHEQAPEYYRAGRFFDVLAQGLTGRRKFVVAAEGPGLPILRMDFADPASAIETLLGD